ncbi:hypothetical protein FD755_009238 [Muntiacus reevesi]|uniref:DDE-1 domain-containing protein n=1 Tax=Muntiacus reevesi TaxID=9886 RepID=A0A5J5MMM0_MUNRE|nr:hypothetical protein FD755_009238 [Muntiacus reevesi]
MAHMAPSCNMNRSIIDMTVKNKDKIMEHVKSAVPMMLTVIVKKPGNMMEKLLSGKMQNQHQCQVPFSLMLIQEKLKVQGHTFMCAHPHNIKVSGKSTSADMQPPGNFPKHIKKLSVKVRIYPMQRMPDRNYISKKENLMPVETLLAYYSENPSTLKTIAKGSLFVVWKSNPKAWVTQAIFQDWFFHHFIIEKYCLKKEIPFNIILLHDDASGHPPFIDDFSPNVKVVNLPLNTSPIQPMDQGIIANFNKYLCHKNIDFALHEFTAVTMNEGWKNICPQFVHDFCELEKVTEESKEVFSNTGMLNEKLQLDLQEIDFTEFLAVHHEKLTNENLMKLDAQRKDKERQKQEEVTEELNRFTMQDIAKGLSLFEEALFIFESQDLNVEQYTKVAADIPNAIQYYHIIYDEKERATTQKSLDSFFKRMDRIESSEEPEPVPSTSGTNATATCPHLLLMITLQLYHLPPPLPPPVRNSSCLLTRCQPLSASYCTVLIYFSRFCTIRLKRMSFLCVFLYYLYESIKNLLQ